MKNMWNWVGSTYCTGDNLAWYDQHIFYLEGRVRKLRGRWFLGLAGIIYFGGNWLIFHSVR
jgi:hypothetical protein